MPLFIADLFCIGAVVWIRRIDRESRRPKTTSPRRSGLIEKHGYCRRKEEFQDAEAAARGVPTKWVE
jgi:hypothetical protein